MHQKHHLPQPALQLLQDRGVEVEVIEYLKTPPGKEYLDFFCTQLGIEPVGLIRTKEKLFKALGLSLKDERSRDEWLEILVQNVKLIDPECSHWRQNKFLKNVDNS